MQHQSCTYQTTTARQTATATSAWELEPRTQVPAPLSSPRTWESLQSCKSLFWQPGKRMPSDCPSTAGLPNPSLAWFDYCIIIPTAQTVKEDECFYFAESLLQLHFPSVKAVCVGGDGKMRQMAAVMASHYSVLLRRMQKFKPWSLPKIHSSRNNSRLSFDTNQTH